ncbi:NEDD4-binding protein 2 [Condylostylus longicornis]|uniref:NEDD4-binding protein 2 n=1 Tax=Condylostylus longicornis TaxID=2530218 RepID=UPI00244E08C0|nr:NEDD4-binding protein 2 [Condylostylus longicornis]
MFRGTKTKSQELIINQLYEIFGYDKEIIEIVCEAQNWKFEDCIENLVSYGENLNNDEETKQNNNNIKDSYATAIKNGKEKFESVIHNFSENKINNLGAVPKHPNVDEKYNELILNDKKIKFIADHIISGHKIMVLMRGPPGCGKSYLARQLVKFLDPPGKYDYKTFICSADDYFYDINDRYVYQPEKISDAHEFNQKKVRKKALEGWSPLIIDNTNIKIWEMLVYVQIAIQYGYLIEILEPLTPWRNSASKLAIKNKHGVTKEKIRRILMNYEPATKNQLLELMKNTRYTCSLPQFRRYPPLEIEDTCEKTSSPERESSNENSDSQQIMSDDKKVETINEPILSSNYDKSNIISHQTVTENISTKNINPSTEKSKLWDSFEENIKEDNVESNCIVNNGSEKQSTLNLETNKNLIDFENETSENINDSCSSWTAYEDSNQPKPQRNVQTGKKLENKHNLHEICEKNNFILNPSAKEWQPYESESSQFWNIQNKSSENALILPKPQRNLTNDFSPNENIFKILKENDNNGSTNDEQKKSKVILKRHSINCPNENESFTLIRQICPDKNVNGLWDLFEKCNGNAQWVLDILLRDDTCVESLSNSSESFDYQCNCNQVLQPFSDTDLTSTNDDLEQHSKNNTMTADITKQKRNKDISEEMLKLKHEIENRVFMDDTQYSEHVRKIRNLKHGVESNSIYFNKPQPYPENLQEENGSDDLVETANEEEMIEINLGKEFIHQLENIFGARPSPNLQNLKTNIFMPKALGKQLYALWMESIYNQLEEEKQETLKKDEEFAILLQSSANVSTINQESYKDILDMEMAWSAYKANPDKWKNDNPQNLATHLAHGKLCEIFPEIEKDTLLQILQAHNNSLSQTIKALNNTDEEDCSDIVLETKNNLLKLAHEETADKLEEDTMLDANTSVKKLSPEEAKKAALRDFEECRNLAAHHSQLKAECYEKAKEAIQKGYSAVAVYYSQISNLHKNKIDFYNHKAASCIMEVHDLTQNNPDFLDLHYLHTMEALECLDIFLDNHISKLRNLNRPYKHIFIITGRGLHSAKGVSTIKNKVKTRLKDRALKWSEVNPGLLKVKVFSASKFSKNS